MKLWMRYEDGSQNMVEINFPCRIGREKTMDIVIKSWRVAKHHANFLKKEGQIYIEDQGSLAGTLYNGSRIHLGGPLKIGDEIIIGPCLITIMDIYEEGSSLAMENTSSVSYQQESKEQQCVQETPFYASFNQKKDRNDRQDAFFRDFSEQSSSPLLDKEIKIENTLEKSEIYVLNQSENPMQQRHTGFDNEKNQHVQGSDNEKHPQLQGSDNENHLFLQREIFHRQRLHALLLDALDLRRRNITDMSDDALRQEVSQILDKLIDKDQEIEHYFDKQKLKQDILNEAIGLGPLEPLLKDNSITEIMVNRFDEIYIERGGRLSKTDTVFSSEKAVLGVIDRIVAPIGRRIDESSPMVDARLLDGSRVNAIIPPIALRGASLTIRKFAQHRPQLQELITLGSLDKAMGEFLDLCVKHRMNIIVSGGTGSGKTTLLNILSNCIPAHERIVTIEDAAELRLNHLHLVSLEARPANVEGKGMVSIRDLVRNALRMRPDRIIVGECRGAEAFDMLGAMNTGHEGSLTTLHANSTRDAFSRLETMIMMADMDLPLTAIREHIANSIHFIVQQTRLSNGRRVISSIAEVGGLESGIIKTQELFAFDKSKQGAFVGRGIMPAIFEKLRQEGEDIPFALFNQYTPALHPKTTFV